ncbi:MAG TPA: CRISPR-associated endonuclease Cas3'' [Thermoanaerobaculia bacterium]|jgi:CRISPR-associated endonuclease/helicase Cas3|nr:CRISPR-associated endonuclease Cas3'' [Thermoanaerobaculia bacterium]
MSKPVGDHSSLFFAHSLEGRPESEWEGLEEHLQKVAQLASCFAAEFGAGEWGRLAGLWHDLGKFQPEFQDRLQGSRESVEHAGVGAALAFEKSRDKGLPLAFAIAGHHAGLADLTTSATREDGRRPLRERLDSNLRILSKVRPHLPDRFTSPELPPFPDRCDLSLHQGVRALEFWTRLLFSCLVDADFLATEDFYKPGLRRKALAGYDEVATLSQRLDDYLDKLVGSLSEDRRSSSVNRRRAEVLAACRAASELLPGLFSLTVPTGGGKTLSAMSFALRHAALHGLRRVIVAIPFTSIIEQNARVYRDALGDANVIEHHTGLDPRSAEKRNREAETRRRLAAENWDAPIVVTTNVQLFESLLAASPSRCRKLHNVSRSVLLLDEAQTLPVGYLLPVLDLLRELTDHYGCTVVFTTATQPALGRRESLKQGFEGVHEIVPDPSALARDLKRIRVDWPDLAAGPRTYAELARELAGLDRVLAVVHLRRDARTLAELLPAEHRFHLSALMCPAHRLQIINEVRERLKEDKPCRLVSTQLIEAGVDVDFPVVYRCLGGLDSLAQAAGRCNREGRAPEPGQVVFFVAETPPPTGTPRDGLEITQEMLREHGGVIDLDDPKVFGDYFRRLYFSKDLDYRGIQPLRQSLSFTSVARRFRLIPDETYPVVVPFGDGGERLAELRRYGPDRLLLRALQPFVVNIREREVSQLQGRGALETIVDGIYALTPVFENLYDLKFGLLVADEGGPDPERLIV